VSLVVYVFSGCVQLLVFIAYISDSSSSHILKRQERGKKNEKEGDLQLQLDLGFAHHPPLSSIIHNESCCC
jgi:hypothetical protein